MRKLADYTSESDARKRWLSPRQRALLVIALGLILTPVVYEYSTLCASRWIAMYGQVSTPHTPVLDALGDYVSEVHSSLALMFRRTFFNLPWKASLIIPLTMLWGFIASLFMSRNR
jgi:hypothetical protein